MIIFVTSAYFNRFIESFQTGDSDIIIGDCEIARYLSGELHVIIHSDVKDQDCLVIGSTAPPDENIITLSMMADALRRSGASKIRAFIPYLGYSRQDKFEFHESSGIELVGSFLRMSGVNEIITIDVHSQIDLELIGLPLKSISASTLFTPVIQELNWEDITIVAPDNGARIRAQEIADSLGIKRPIAYMVKIHRDNGVAHLDLIGEVGKRAVIVDDIVDVGHTIISACDALRVRGVQEIAVAVTHGVFSNGAWYQLLELGIQSIFVSDSCPEVLRQTHPSIHVISLNKLVPMVLAEIKKS